MLRFDKYTKRIARELRKLETTTAEQPIARRNARRRVLSAMRLLRGAVDEGYPAIVDRSGTKRLKTFAGRLARIKKAGWCERDSVDAGRYAVLGVKVKRVQWTNGTDTEWRYFIPAWADAIGLDPTELRKALKDRKARDAAVVAQALTR